MGRMARAVRAYMPDLVAGVESRGFLIAAPLALKLGCGFIMIRKRGKLPGETVGLNYALEYGEDRVEIQADAVQPGQRVVVVDDLLATGGTMAAGIALLRQVGAVVPAAAALIELSFLNGRVATGCAVRGARFVRRVATSRNVPLRVSLRGAKRRGNPDESGQCTARLPRRFAPRNDRFPQ